MLGSFIFNILWNWHQYMQERYTLKHGRISCKLKPHKTTLSYAIHIISKVYKWTEASHEQPHQHALDPPLKVSIDAACATGMGGWWKPWEDATEAILLETGQLNGVKLTWGITIQSHMSICHTKLIRPIMAIDVSFPTSFQNRFSAAWIAKTMNCIWAVSPFHTWRLRMNIWISILYNIHVYKLRDHQKKYRHKSPWMDPQHDAVNPSRLGSHSGAACSHVEEWWDA